MAYAQIHVDAIDHFKVGGLSDAAFRLWVTGLCYCQKHLTDGVIDRRALKMLRAKTTAPVVRELVEAGLWHDEGPGYTVHDFAAWNRTRQQIEDQREKWRGKKRGIPPSSPGETSGNLRGVSDFPSTDTIRSDTQRSEKSEKSAPAAPLSQAELHQQTPREALFEHWRQVAEAHGVLEPAARTPKECHQAASLLEVHALDALRPAVTAFWGSPAFDGKRSFGMFHSQAPQLVAHVKAAKPYPFGAPPREVDKAVREAKLEAWTPPAPLRQAVAR